MLAWALKKILGTSHERELKRLRPLVDEINKLEGPGRGVTVVKTGDDERVIGFVAGDKATTMVIENAAGKAWTLHADPKEVTARGGKGHQLQKKTTFTRPPVPVTIPSLGSAEGK